MATLWLASIATAQQSRPWLFGLVPGEDVMLPQVSTMQGEQVKRGVPTLVFFTLLGTHANSAFEDIRMAKRWQERHPEVQILLVDGRTQSVALAAWIDAQGIDVAVVADEDGLFQEAFGVNLHPILFILDQSGMIRDKVLGRSLTRFIEIDAVLAWAATGAWERVDEQRLRPLRIGERPAHSLAGVELNADAPTVIYQTSPTCPPCQEIQQTGFQEAINTLAQTYPDVRLILLQSDTPLEVMGGIAERYAEIYGREALPASLYLYLERGQEPDVIFEYLPEEGWAPNVHLVNYQEGTASDPVRWWGQTLTPNLMFFEAGGVYQGPAPIWEGPYSLDGLLEAIETFLGKSSY
jgi:thiol-disulfide isomerase/thioredoxin